MSAMKPFLADLQRHWSEPSTFEKKGEFIASIRDSGLTSQEICQLRDSIDTSPTPYDSEVRRNVVKGLLDDLYQERRAEEKEWASLSLEPEQRELLCTMVEAYRSLPADKRTQFLVTPSDRSHPNGSLLLPGAKGFAVALQGGDLDILVSIGVLMRSGIKVNILPKGFKYYSYCKGKGAEAGRQVESYYLSSHSFAQVAKRYPVAYDKWKEATELLWRSEGSKSHSTIGHLCREAVQEFIWALAKAKGIAAPESEKQKIIALFKQVSAAISAAGSNPTGKMLESLLVFFGEVSDLIQRQEHGATKEGQELVWEDSRRVVFLTGIIMVEVDRSMGCT